MSLPFHVCFGLRQGSHESLLRAGPEAGAEVGAVFLLGELNLSRFCLRHFMSACPDLCFLLPSGKDQWACGVVTSSNFKGICSVLG